MDLPRGGRSSNGRRPATEAEAVISNGARRAYFFALGFPSAACSRRTLSPDLTRAKSFGSPSSVPRRFTGLYGSCPKKMQKARPGGQYATAPDGASA